ncbi:hypothetical protein GCK72_012025 [Caenorhabditis remanei]|uniref:K Homology domain-containing protein n=1 Tax=Caenorhabditis remanei TaxID=31234 RepID=A0A6A5GM09_CAERE|nr:hypothetical protein GCK72_012025 [Caenorhabditis remanei]KAF1755575.1 hypothetical protein GCK72_012025 [Caenorhabditis remanei]
MSERKRTLDVDQEGSASKRPLNSDPIDYSNDYSPRSPSPIRSPSIASYSPCPSPSPPVSPTPIIRKIERRTFEVPEKFLDSERDGMQCLRIHSNHWMDENCLFGREDIELAIDRIDELVTSSVGFIHQVATRYLKFGDGMSPRSPSPPRKSLRSEYSPYKSPRDESDEDIEIIDNPRVSRELLIPSGLYGSFGSPMREQTVSICKRNGVNWNVPDAETSSKTEEKLVMRLYGVEENVEKAMKEIEEFMENYSEDEMLIHTTKVSRVIGKNGETIQLISEKSGAVCHFDRESLDDSLESSKTLRITGTATQIEKAKEMVQDLIDSTRCFMEIPYRLYDDVVGDKKENIAYISAVSGAECVAWSGDDERKTTIRIQGTEKQVEHAKSLLQDAIDKEHKKGGPLVFNTMHVPIEKVDQVIGVSGSYINLIREQSNACIEYDPRGPVKKFLISGTTVQVETAKALIKEVTDGPPQVSIPVWNRFEPRMTSGPALTLTPPPSPHSPLFYQNMPPQFSFQASPYYPGPSGPSNAPRIPYQYLPQPPSSLFAQYIPRPPFFPPR